MCVPGRPLGTPPNDDLLSPALPETSHALRRPRARPPRLPAPSRLLPLLGACTACAASLFSGGCAPLAPEASQIAASSSGAIDALRRARGADPRDQRVRARATRPALRPVARRGRADRPRLARPRPRGPAGAEQRLDVSAVVIGLREEVLAGIAQTEASLLARSDRHHAQARRLTDALSAYLLARTESEALRRSLAEAASRRVGIDPDELTIDWSDLLPNPSAQP
ncbi:MAG: hypothetical protein ACFHWZ_05615 [Phycisphaerales bacterium]